MNGSFDFKVGPPDDAENFTVMRVGIQAKKNALRSFKEMQNAILKAAPEVGAKEGLAYMWQGMISQAAYTIVIAHTMLTKAEWEFKGEKAEIDLLVEQVRKVAKAFVQTLPGDPENG